MNLHLKLIRPFDLLRLYAPVLLILCYFACPVFSAPSILKLEKVIGDPAFRHSGDIVDIVPLPDGKRVLTSGVDGSARLWDLATGAELRRYVDDSKSYVWDVFLLPDNKTFLTAGASKQVVRWNIETGASNVIYKATNSIFRVVQSADLKLLAMATAEGCVVWDIDKKKELHSFSTDDKDAYSVCFLKNAQYVMAGFEDKGGIVKDLGDKSTRFELPQDCEGVYSLIPSSDESRLLVCTAKKGLMCLDAETFAIKWAELTGKSSIYSAAWSPDQTKVAVICNDGAGNLKEYSFYVLNAEDGQVVIKMTINRQNNHYGISFTVDGKYILCASGNVLAKYDAETGERVFPAGNDLFFDNEGLSTIALIDSGKKLLTDNEKTGLRMFDAVTGKAAGVWRDDVSFRNMAVSSDGRMIAGSNDSQVFVIDADTGGTVSTIHHDSGIRSFAFAGGSRYLLVQSYQGSAVYEIPSGRLMKPLEGMEGMQGTAIDRVTSQTKGSLFACVKDSLIMVYDINTSKQIGSMTIPCDAGGVAFFPADGTALMAAAGTNIYLWASDASVGGVSEKKITKALAQLGAKQFSDRERATKFLIEQGNAGLEAVKRANTADPEVRDRVARIIGSIQSTQIYGEPCDKAEVSCGVISGLKTHPSLNLWVGLTAHPSASKIVIGDVHEQKIRILSVIEDPNGVSDFCFGPESSIYTANRNGTISVYKITD